MEMLYKYKEVFRSRDEIGTCPNIEVGIDVMDKSPFFIRPYHVREEDKKVIDKEMKPLCYLGILKEGFSPYSSLVMLISQKLTQDKRVMMDFRHLNVRIAKNNLAYPLVRDTFSVLGNSKCEVLSVLDLKTCLSFIKTFGRSKKELQYITIFQKCILHISKNAHGMKHISINLAIIYKQILECLESKKHCKAIMDDLLLFTPTKKLHMAKLEDLLKALLKNGLKISTKKCQLFKTELQYMGNIIFI